MILLISSRAYSQGTWTALTNLAPNPNGGVMLVLSDGSVMCKTFSGGTDGYGNLWDRLTATKKGVYSKGKWKTNIGAMARTRLYFSSQVLKDGRVYVAGGEYGTDGTQNGSHAEVWDPLTNVWTAVPTSGTVISDANSEIMEDGRVLQAFVSGTLKSTKFWDPATNTYSAAPSCLGIHNECAWVKLADSSILMVDRNTTKCERYIPSLNSWVADADVPVALYDSYGLETGGAGLLPNGKAFFIGSIGHCAIYTPSGNNSPGSWVATGDIPNSQGCPDAPAAMMINGKVLMATSPKPSHANHFPSPTSFYEYDYVTNTFTQVNAPGGGLTVDVPCYETNFVDLPNGQVLYGVQHSSQYFVYKPDGSPLASGKPTVNTVSLIAGTTYRITGTLFNGICEGATYGDDWQMNTNYPIVRLTSGAYVYYARTHDWNSTGVMRASLPDTALLDLPKGLLNGTYSLVVSANGIASDPVTFVYSPEPQPVIAANSSKQLENLSAYNFTRAIIYPNPATKETSVQFTLKKTSTVVVQLLDINGSKLREAFNGTMQAGDHLVRLSVDEFPTGIYFVRIMTETEVRNLKLVIE